MSAPPAACRSCSKPLEVEMVDLGGSPLANSFLAADELNRMEPHYPLRALVCSGCLLVQLEAFESREHIFSNYVYFSSWSTSWLAHAEAFVDAAVDRLRLGQDSFVVELASNDGYLLRNVVARGIRALGVEPAANVAEIAIDAGIPTLVEFFGRDVGAKIATERQADLIVANNVLAHVPDVHDFVAGIAALLAPAGSVSIEFPHLLTLVRDCQYDTIYHEHFSYFSLRTARGVLRAHGLEVVDVEHLETHGGSLRIWAAHEGEGRPPSDAVEATLDDEKKAGLEDLDTYRSFASRVAARKRTLLVKLIALRDAGLTVAAYGAAAKGNTLLNHCGVDRDLVAFVVDASTAKQGRFLPGSHIPVLAPSALDEQRPDVLLILPWNLQREVIEATVRIREWGGRWLLQDPDLALTP